MSARSSELQLNTDEPFQKAEWRLQRVAWIFWTLIVIAALAGLAGPGPLSSTETSAPDNSLTVAYDRFLHYHHPTQLVVTFGPEASDRQLLVKLDRSLLDRLQVERIEPEPLRSELTKDGNVYAFAQTDSGGKIVFHVDYERFGKSSGRIELVGHEPATLDQFVYP